MSMGDKFDKLFEKMKLEFHKQTIELTYSLTSNLSRKIDEKLKPILEENKALKEEIETLEKRIAYLERDNKRNNVVIFGLKEQEENSSELLEVVREKITSDLEMAISKAEINQVYRIGKANKAGKPRPVVISFVNAWKRDEVLRNKKKFKKIIASEDFPKEVLAKRKSWQSEMMEERSKGKIAYLVYDKLLVKPGNVRKDETNVEPSTASTSKENEEEKPRRRARANINKFDFVPDYVPQKRKTSDY